LCEFEGRAEQVFEGATMLLAVTRAHLHDLLDAASGGHIKKNLHAEVDTAVKRGSASPW